MFDLIDNCILAGKLENPDLPLGIVSWIIHFLKDWKQSVKLSQECFFEWNTVPAGVPQGTKLGPWLFLVMINDLNLGNLDLWKFVDDMTTAELVPNSGVSKIQDSVDDLVNITSANKLKLNVPKCKELRISFAKTEPKFNPIVVNSKPLEIVEMTKVLELNISCNLKWNALLSEVLEKGASRLYFLRQLKRSNIATKDLFSFYLVCVRPITEYACQVFYNALPQYLSEDLERLQKCSLWIIFPALSYREALNASNLPTLKERRELLTTTLFKEAVENGSHKLNIFLPPQNKCSFNLRSKCIFNVKFKMNRSLNTFITLVMLWNIVDF